MGARFVDRVGNPSKLAAYSVKSIGGTMKTIKAGILAAMIVLGLTSAFVGASFFSSTVLADNRK